MNYTDWSSKLTQVFESTKKKALLDFMADYARSHDDFAMALVNQFWKAEKDDYRSMVQKCLMHPTRLGPKSTEAYDWTAVAIDLSAMMRLAQKKEKEGNFLDAAEIARWVIVLPCEEYEKDHPYGEQLGEMWCLRRKLLRDTMDQAKEMVTRLLIKGDGIDEDSQRGLMKEIVEACKPYKKTRICKVDELIEDAQEKILSEKRYLTWLSKKLDSTRGDYFKVPYFEKKIRFLDRLGRRHEAIEVMGAYRRSDDLLYQSIQILLEWKDYEKALELTDIDPKERIMFMHHYDELTMEILDLIGDPAKRIAVCKDRFRKHEIKKLWFNKLHELLSPVDWEHFLDETIADAAEVFSTDLNGIEAQIYVSRGQYDKIIIACQRHEYKCEDYLKLYGKHMSEADQRLAAQEMVDRMKSRAPECKSTNDYLHFANWVKDLSKLSPVCRKIAKEVMNDILKEYPKSNFRWAFVRVDMIQN